MVCFCPNRTIGINQGLQNAKGDMPNLNWNFTERNPWERFKTTKCQVPTTIRLLFFFFGGLQKEKNSSYWRKQTKISKRCQRRFAPQERVEFLEKLSLNGNILRRQKIMLIYFYYLESKYPTKGKLSNFCQRRFAQYSWIFNHK